MARISVQGAVVASVDRQIAQDRQGGGDGDPARPYRRDDATGRRPKRNRADLVGKHDQAASALASLKAKKAGIEGQAKVAEADLGPVRYLATLLGAGDQDVLRWFIVASLLDPAAVLLVLAATRR